MHYSKTALHLLLVSSFLCVVFGAIANNRKENAVVRQDDETGTPAEGEDGAKEEETIDPESLTSVDRFVYGFNALVKAFEVFFAKIDKKVERKVMTLEDFLNLIHDQVHVNGTEDFHETAYITMREEK